MAAAVDIPTTTEINIIHEQLSARGARETPRVEARGAAQAWRHHRKRLWVNSQLTSMTALLDVVKFDNKNLLNIQNTIETHNLISMYVCLHTTKTKFRYIYYMCI